MGTSPLPNPQLSPPLGNPVCPDPRFAAGRALVLQGPQTFLGALWVFTATLEGQAAGPPPVIPPPPGPEGSIPFVDDDATAYALPPAPDEAEGSTPFSDEG